jgi:hypothetical protein
VGSLEAGGTLSDGDRVRTETDSRAEIRPYPYFYLFMNGRSEIRFADSEDSDVSVEIVKERRGCGAGNVSKSSRTSSLKLIAGEARFEIGREGYLSPQPSRREHCRNAHLSRALCS